MIHSREFTLEIDYKQKKLYFRLPPSRVQSIQTPWPGIFAEALAYADEKTRPPNRTALNSKAFRDKIAAGARPSTKQAHVAIALQHLPERWSDRTAEFLEHVKHYIQAIGRHVMPGDRIRISQ